MLLKQAIGHAGIEADDNLLDEFERILHEADQDILDWVFGKTSWPARYRQVLPLLYREKTSQP